jgi:signal transduction histidine kinase/ActR/RegA family two-component response regulator
VRWWLWSVAIVVTAFGCGVGSPGAALGLVLVAFTVTALLDEWDLRALAQIAESSARGARPVTARSSALARAIGVLRARSNDETVVVDRAPTAHRPVPLGEIAGNGEGAEREILAATQRRLGTQFAPADVVLLTRGDNGDVTVTGTLPERGRFEPLAQKLFGEYLRSGGPGAFGVRDGRLSRSLCGEFVALGYRYTVALPFGWSRDGETLRGVVWLGYTAARPPTPYDETRLRAGVGALEEDLALAGTVEALSSRVAEVESLNREKSDFIAHISHDIRSPLNNIRAILSLLRDSVGWDGEGSSDSGELIEVALRNCDALGDIVADVLDFSRHKAGRLTARPERVDLGAIVGDVIESFRVAARQKGLALECSVPREETAAWADSRHLRRIVTNLIGNAVKYTERGSVQVSVGVVEGTVRVRVVDTGVGMTPEEVTRLFRPFTRFASPECEGVGLGLTVSRILAELNGGAVEVASTFRVGSTFELRVPRYIELGMSEATHEERAEDMGAQSVKPITALIVDDDPDSVASLARALSTYGVVSAVATSVIDAVGVYNFSPPDVVITDARMPHGGGERLITFVERAGLGTPVFVLSGFGHVDEARALIDGGATGVFQKPVDVESLFRELIAAVGRKQGASRAEDAQSEGPRISGAVTVRKSRSSLARRLEKIVSSPGPHDSSVPDETSPTRVNPPVFRSKVNAGPPESPRHGFAPEPS